MRITQKLGVLVAVPLCAVSGFGALALTTSATGMMQADHLWSLMNTANAAGELARQLQTERTQAALLLTAPPNAVEVQGFTDQAAKTLAVSSAYQDLVANLRHTTASTQDLLQRIDSDLAALTALRAQITSGSAPALSAVIFQYRIAIADLMTFQDSVAQAGSAPPDIAQKMRASSALAQASESAGQEEAMVLRLAIGVPLTPSSQQDISVSRSGYATAMELFDSVATPEWRELPDQALTGSNVAEAQRLEDSIARAPVGAHVQVDPQQWTLAMTARMTALESVQDGINNQTLDAISELRAHQRWLTEVEATAIGGTVLLALMLSLRLGRPMIRGLRELRDGAHAVAYDHLPAAVEALRVGGALADKTPEEFADEAGNAVRVSGNDELAAVARAFNAVHHEAVRTAAEESLLRTGIGAAFVGLARRGERLTSALTIELDKAERDEQDPDRLARLFVLDHLAARMSRNNESLLVLGGEGTTKIRDRGVPLIDVIRGALGRIERYSRVDPANIDQGVIIAPGAVDHLVHLCAELLDNATQFSSPDTRVTVDARLLADRVIIQASDRGIGLTDAQRDELNARLSSPRTLDITAIRAMGLTVSAHLASWYGIDIELRARPDGGTIAELTLPPTMYWAPGMLQAPAAEPETPARAPMYPVPDIAAPMTGPAAGSMASRTSAGGWSEHADANADTPSSRVTRPRIGLPIDRLAETPVRGTQQWSPVHAQSQDREEPDHGTAAQSGTTQDHYSDLDAWQQTPSAPGPQFAPAHAQAPNAEQFPMQHPMQPPMQYPPDTAAPAAADPPFMPGAAISAAYQSQPAPQSSNPSPFAPPAPAGVPQPREAGEHPVSPWLAGNVQRSAADATLSGSLTPAMIEGAPETTLHGLPKRVPLARLPAGAIEAPDDEPEADPAERDPSKVSATMAAYARGLSGRVPESSPNNPPYPPMSSTGNF